MAEPGAYGDRLGRVFRLPAVPVLKTQTLRKAQLAVTELKYDAPAFGTSEPLPREDAFLIALHVSEVTDHQLWYGGRPFACTPFAARSTSIVDLRRDLVTCIGCPFHFVVFYVPLRALNEVADEFDGPPIDDLRYQPGVGIDDPVVRHLGLSLLPALARPQEASTLFVDHVALALRAQVAHAYGGLRLARRWHRGGLMAWQQRRAKELLDARLDGEISLDAVAKECGLSPSQFSRAFRQSTGNPPHRWLLQRRIDRAKDLLHHSALQLAEIALDCGFANQSHFTRVFAKLTGASPGAWRRMRRS